MATYNRNNNNSRSARPQGRSFKTDLITVVQNGNEKQVTRDELLRHLESAVNKANSEIASIKRSSSENVKKTDAAFTSPVSGSTPSAPNHLATKQYIDASLHNVVRNDGAVKLDKNLSYRVNPKRFEGSDVITKTYADNLLLGVLKTVRKYNENILPAAVAGDCFIMESFYEIFSVDGPEIQKGDILICLEDSSGGEYSAVGHQFAILNTNVVSATEENAGILRISNDTEVKEFSSDNSALTPKKYKDSILSSSNYNRTQTTASSYLVNESDKGLLSIDTRRGTTEVILPSVVSLDHPELFKITVKDEYGQAGLNNITIKPTGATIDGKNSIVLSNNYQSSTIYNDGSNYFIENNNPGVSAGGEINKFKALTGPAYVSATGADEAVFQFDIDLAEFSLNEGFIFEVSGLFAANTNTKTLKLVVDGNTTVTNATTTAPNNDYFVARVTVLKANKYAMSNGYILLEGIAADTYGSMDVNLDWNSIITVSATANAATAITDIQIHSAYIQPLK